MKNPRTGAAILPLGALLFGLSLLLASAPAQNLVTNGDFEKGTTAWGGGDALRIIEEGGRKHLAVVKPGGAATQRVPLPPNSARLQLRFRMRVSNVTLGDQSWKDARLAMDFRDAAGKQTGGWPDVLHLVGNTPWTNLSRTYQVPPDAVALNLGAANFGSSGVAEFDDLVIEAAIRPSAPVDAALPAGVTDPWNTARAWRQVSRTSERLCLNGLWAFLPVAKAPEETPPAVGQGWGWFKVPGLWRQSKLDNRYSQELLISPWMEGRFDPESFDQAWYRREVETPAAWRGRRIALEFTLVQTHARVFVDGKPAGECWFPGGLVDLTAALKPGSKQSLEILLTARPLEAESTSFSAPDRVAKSKAVVPCKGITGDLFLVSEPMKQAVADVHVICSTRKKSVTLDLGLRAPAASPYQVSAIVLDKGKPVKTFSTKDFGAAVLDGGRLKATAPWADAKTWDTDTPSNQYEILVSLLDAKGALVCESTPVRFGFREFWIDGRDFYLNGRKIHLRALFLNNPAQHAVNASYAGALETCRKLAEYGFNYYIFGNYDFAPGSVGYLDGLLGASDDSGLLAGFSLPHMKDFNSKIYLDEQAARYRALAEWLIRRVQNHPSVIAYAMNHNATGYFGDQNPLKIDGVYSPDTNLDPKARRNQARACAAIARSIDPTRALYHHQSGNLDDMHTVNIYLNWAPRQERSEWIGHWSTNGVKPLFFVEWGEPHIASFSSFRGPEFIWRHPTLQSVWLAEYSAPWAGESAYEMTAERAALQAAEEKYWNENTPFNYGAILGTFREKDALRLGVPAHFLDDNWRSHRAWGISAMLPWDQEASWMRVKETPVVDHPARWADLNRPGIVPDTTCRGSQYIIDSDPDAFAPTAIGKAWLRWNKPLCAFIGGAGVFTDKTHLFRPGEKFAKQLVVLNDLRREVTCRYAWKLGTEEGKGEVIVAAGERAFVPLLATAPASGDQTLTATFDFGAERQEDRFVVSAIPEARTAAAPRVYLHDPKGMTSKLFARLGIAARPLAAGAVPERGSLLVIGREALAGGAACPDLSGVPAGLKVLFFEQDCESLMNRLGLRATEVGLRTVFRRSASHPVLAGLPEAALHDWRGASTLTPPFLPNLPVVENADPSWFWCGFENKRVWRCGNSGNLASVLIEKPPVGHWRPLLDGGFDLQYAPLLEYIEGQGRIVFCQLDLTARTADDPAADALARRLVAYLAAAEPEPARKVVYAGGDKGAALLTALGVSWTPLGGQLPGREHLLVLAPGAGAVDVAGARAKGAHLLALGLPEADMARFFPAAKVSTGSELSRLIPDLSSAAYNGLSQAELHWRTRPAFARLLDTDATSSAALRATTAGASTLVLCQVAPWDFDAAKKPYLRPTFRRSAFLVSRLLANLGAPSTSPLLSRLRLPAQAPVYDLSQGWVGKEDRQDAGRGASWWKDATDDRDWPAIPVPGLFDSLRPELAGYDGLFWYRLHFRLPKGYATEGAELRLGAVDDESWTWLNGRFLGETSRATHPSNYWSAKRRYPLEASMLREGENVLTVLVNDLRGGGGIVGIPHLFRNVWDGGFYLDGVEAGDDPYRYYRW
ncbi:MAG: beta galactosidase jelly roll domain-containing protein [Spirochaetes bacterium]|nr:beta galactosidase jelly roll domain-containing protein [Spirochaetota bacterium]